MTTGAVHAVSFASGGALRPTLDVERRLWREGHRWVAGVDEVGRGAWAGPLSVGVAVVHAGMRPRAVPHRLRDSKLLAEHRREAVFEEVARWCADGAVGHATPDECDRFGMTRAWRLAAHRALADLEIEPDVLVVDGPYDFLRARAFRAGRAGVEPNDEAQASAPCDHRLDEAQACARPDGFELPDAPVPSRVLTIVGADARCAAVSAASVLAKVVRDRMMRAEAAHFPPYGFDRNKGYPSALHQIALRGYGLSAIHRRSWAYVADLPWR
jgi:ribonuclease HII